MGLFSKAVNIGTGGLINIDDLTGKTAADAAAEAARIQGSAIGQASELTAANFDEIRKLVEQQLGSSNAQFAPFAAAGASAIPGVTQGATIGGLDANIAQILNSDSFQPLVDKRTQAVQNQLAAGGLTRSGTAITEAANIPSDLAFQIENLVSGRQTNLFNSGLDSTSANVGNQNNLINSIIAAMSGKTSALSTGITGPAGARATGILSGAQSKAAGQQNILNLGATIGAAAIGAPGASSLLPFAAPQTSSDSFLTPQTGASSINIGL